MSELISYLTNCEMQPDGQNAASFTIQTRDGKNYIITNCHELRNPLYVDDPRVYWGQYEYTGDDGLSHCVKAFVFKYQGDTYDLVLCK